MLKLYHIYLLRFIATAVTAGSLRDIISGKYTGPHVSSRVEIIQQIANGLAQLHAKQCFHGVLKPSNILISLAVGSTPPMMKLANFAFVPVRKTKSQSPFWKNVLKSGSSRSWLPPEIYHSNCFTFEMDVFVCGLIL